MTLGKSLNFLKPWFPPPLADKISEWGRGEVMVEARTCMKYLVLCFWEGAIDGRYWTVACILASVSLLSYFQFVSENKGWIALQIYKNWIQSLKGMFAILRQNSILLKFHSIIPQKSEHLFCPGHCACNGCTIANRTLAFCSHQADSWTGNVDI